jgi:hypothetical protein
MSSEEIATAFVQHYYTTLGADPAQLHGLYQAHSVLTFEGVKSEGPDQIVAKFKSIGRVQHNIAQLTKDVQLSLNQSSMLIFITGQMIIDNNPPLHFSQMFQLVATGPGNFYIHNEVMRLIYG